MAAKEKVKSEPIEMSAEMETQLGRLVNQIAAIEAAEGKLAKRKKDIRDQVRQRLGAHGRNEFEASRATAKLITTTKRTPTPATWTLLAKLSPEQLEIAASVKAAAIEDAKDQPRIAALLPTLKEKEATRLVVETRVEAKVSVETGAKPNRAKV